MKAMREDLQRDSEELDAEMQKFKNEAENKQEEEKEQNDDE